MERITCGPMLNGSNSIVWAAGSRKLTCSYRRQTMKISLDDRPATVQYANCRYLQTSILCESAGYTTTRMQHLADSTQPRGTTYRKGVSDSNDSTGPCRQAVLYCLPDTCSGRCWWGFQDIRHDSGGAVGGDDLRLAIVVIDDLGMIQSKQ